MGVAPRVQSRLSRALHAHYGVKLLTDLRNQERNTSRRAMVRFRGARERRHGICRVPGNLAGGNDAGLPVEGDPGQEPEIARRSRCSRRDVLR